VATNKWFNLLSEVTLRIIIWFMKAIKLSIYHLVWPSIFNMLKILRTAEIGTSQSSINRIKEKPPKTPMQQKDLTVRLHQPLVKRTPCLRVALLASEAMPLFHLVVATTQKIR
jgi:hypothetical protein